MQPALRKDRCQRLSHVCPQRPGVPGLGLQPEMLSDRCVHFGFSPALQSPPEAACHAPCWVDLWPPISLLWTLSPLPSSRF